MFNVEVELPKCFKSEVILGQSCEYVQEAVEYMGLESKNEVEICFSCLPTAALQSTSKHSLKHCLFSS